MKQGEVQEDLDVAERRKGLKIGICFNGRQAPGGNPIIYGLIKYCEENNSELVGFLSGTKGLFENNSIKITWENFHFYNN